MAWSTEFERSAGRELEKLGHDAVRRILRYLHDRVAPLDDRVARILLVRIGHRRDVYR